MGAVIPEVGPFSVIRDVFPNGENLFGGFGASETSRSEEAVPGAPILLVAIPGGENDSAGPSGDDVAELVLPNGG